MNDSGKRMAGAILCVVDSNGSPAAGRFMSALKPEMFRCG